MTHALELIDVHAGYGRIEVLRGVDLKVPKGAVMALLGPNGAGKTTILRMVAGLLKPDTGSISVYGIDAREAERHSNELIDWLGLRPHANERCGGFSKGMLQKVALAGALVHDPRLIILDEPLTGLDAGSARQVKDVLKQKVAQGVTVIMTTHILEVAERMAERIGVINHGRLVAEGTLAELRARIGRETTLEEIFLDLVAEKEADAAAEAAA
jgi:ABC-2 type transport system ATP-binding protein